MRPDARGLGAGFVAVVGMLLGSATPLVGQAALRGIVRLDSTGRPLPGIEVLLEGTERRAVTDNAGRFLLGELPAGRRIALFRSVGFRPFRLMVTLVTRDTVWADAMLVPASAQELAPLVVTERPKGPRGIGLEAFEERRRLGFGKFIDSTELRRSEHLPLASVLRRVPGMVVWTVKKQPPRHVAVSGRRPGACPMKVYLDGVPKNLGEAPVGPGPPPPLKLVPSGGTPSPQAMFQSHKPEDVELEDFTVASLVAIEVYRGAAEVPVEYGGAGAGCGVVLLWTRRGN